MDSILICSTDQDEWRHRILAENPGLLEKIREAVKEWPPMSNEAIRLCRAAKRNYLQSIANQESK